METLAIVVTVARMMQAHVSMLDAFSSSSAHSGAHDIIGAAYVESGRITTMIDRYCDVNRFSVASMADKNLSYA
jgi:hypothetical protein